MLGPLGSALKQIHEVTAVYLPAFPQKHAVMRDTSVHGTLETLDKVDQVAFQQPEIRINLPRPHNLYKTGVGMLQHPMRAM